MGFKQVEIVPITTTGPTPLIPSGKPHQIKVFQVARSETVAVVKARLPAQASVTNVLLYRSIASDAATTATVTITISDNSGVISTGTYDVKTNGAVTGIVNMTNLPNIENVPVNGDLVVSAVYAETGTASTTGGPWKVAVEYAA